MALDCDKHVWIKNNREVEVFCGINDGRLFYTDLLTEQEMNQEKDSEQKKKYYESVKDF